MKRVHAHIFVKDLDESTRFYNQLFAAQPSLIEHDYVRWELTDPPMNFAISNKGKPGIDHLGIQTADDQSLHQLVDATGLTDAEPEETSCCYARSTKTWLSDPQGIQWELFHTHHNEKTFMGKEPVSCCESSGCCN